MTLVIRNAGMVEASIPAPGCEAEAAVVDVSDLAAGAAFFNRRLASLHYGE